MTPFVVGEDGGGDEDDGEDAEEDLHDVLRIAWVEGLRRKRLTIKALESKRKPIKNCKYKAVNMGIPA